MEMSKEGYSTIVFIRPNGKKEHTVTRFIYQEDTDYLKSINCKLSMEDIGMDYALYFDYGAKTKDGEPDELTVLALGKNCQDTIHEAVVILKTLIQNGIQTQQRPASSIRHNRKYK